MSPQDFSAIEKKLNQKQRLFVAEYLACGSYKQALQKAGYNTTAPSTLGGNMMRTPKIKAYFEALQNYTTKSNVVTHQMVTDFLKDVVNFRVTDWVKVEGGKVMLKDPNDLEKIGHLVKSIKQHKKTGDIEVVFYDKLDAIEKINKNIGFYKEDNLQKSTVAAVQIYLPDNGRNPKPELNEPATQA